MISCCLTCNILDKQLTFIWWCNICDIGHCVKCLAACDKMNDERDSNGGE